MNQEKSSARVVIAILILTAALIAYASLAKPKSNTYTYKGPGGEFRIVKENIGGMTFYKLTAYASYNNIGMKKYEIYFRNKPETLKNIEVPKKLKNLFLNYTRRGTKMFITVDSNSDPKIVLAGIELARIIGKGESGIYRINTQGALTDSPNETKMPKITCNDSNEKTGVIYIKQGAQTKAALDKNKCLIIEGQTPDDAIAVADKIGYILLNVIEN